MQFRSDKKKSGGNKIGTIILMVVLWGFIAFSLVNIFVRFGEIRKLDAQARQYQEEIERQKVKNDELAGVLDRGITREENENIARDKLGLAADGEQVFYNTDRQ